MAKTYENGFAQGKTAASLEGIAKAQDAIFDKLNHLPCTEHFGSLSALKAHCKYMWILMCLVLGAIGGLALKAIFG